MIEEWMPSWRHVHVEQPDFEEIERTINAYFSEFPEGGAKRGPNAVVDALMIALRRANNSRERCLIAIGHQQETIEKLTVPLRDAISESSALWAELKKHVTGKLTEG